MAHTTEEKAKAIAAVIDTLDILRRECPWDRKQTNESLRPNTIEEVYELCDALMGNDANIVKKELGDVLLHVLFYSKIGEEQGAFDMADVATALNEKLIYRHPHVFGNTKADDAEAVTQNWEQLKLREKGGNRTVLAGVPVALPALIKAFRVQEKASNVGFDWHNPDGAWQKFAEESAEFRNEADSMDRDRMESEMGDLLFSLVNVARLYGINPENALERTNRKFISRFNHVERRITESGRKLSDTTLEEMDRFWNEAKEQENR